MPIFGKEAPLSRGIVWDAATPRYMNISKAREILGYVPRVELSEAIRISCQVSRLSDNNADDGDANRCQQHYQAQLNGQSYDREETLQ
jgi:hypothetical protein